MIAASEPGLPAAPWVNSVDGSEMIVIPAGPFLVGHDRIRATAEAFSLGRHPITNEQFRRFLDATAYRPDLAHPDNDKFLAHWPKGKCPQRLARHPVVFVSLVDAVHYLRWAGLTLPTEWYWEKAARGDDGRRYPWGDSIPSGKQPYRPAPEKLANVGTAAVCAIGSYPRTRTPYGCEDLVGNVSEWCLLTPPDDYGRPPPETAPQLPVREAMRTRSIVRGACFLRTTIRALDAENRRFLSMTRRNAWTGFRPASLRLSAEPSPAK